MARVKSILQLNGRVGDTIFRRTGGQTIAGMAGGPTKNQILTAPEFHLTRLNMSEFGGAAMYAKIFYDTSEEIIFQCSRNKSSMRKFIASLRKTMSTNVNMKTLGARTPYISKEQEGFNINSKNTLGSVFSAPISEMEKSIGRDSVTLTFEEITPSMLNAPNGATHFKLFVGLTALAPMYFNESTKKYELTGQKIHKVNTSGYLKVDEVEEDVTVITLFSGSPVIESDTSLIVVLGISYYKKVGDVYNKMFEKDAIQIIDVDAGTPKSN